MSPDVTSEMIERGSTWFAEYIYDCLHPGEPEGKAAWVADNRAKFEQRAREFLLVAFASRL